MDKKKTNSQNVLYVEARTPEELFFKGEARSVSSINNTGPFDILPMHENFITIIKDKLLVLPVSEAKKEFPLDIGILKVYGNKVDVFIGFQFNM